MKKRPLMDKFMEKFMADPNSGCWLWTGCLNVGGYGTIADGGRPRSAHRVAYELLVGPLPDGLDIMHKCDVPSCVNPAHLVPGTTRENVRDMVRKGRNPNYIGQNNPRAKLTPEMVAKIRAMAANGETYQAISAHFPVTKEMVCKVVNRENWRHV